MGLARLPSALALRVALIIINFVGEEPGELPCDDRGQPLHALIRIHLPSTS
jgi:hypothetical protein